MADEVKCPYCGEQENLHYNYEWHLPVPNASTCLCNECGGLFEIPKLDEKTNKDESESI